MTSVREKDGRISEGIKLLLCENSLQPIEEAISAAQADIPRSNYQTESSIGPVFVRITTALLEDNALVI